MPGADQNQPTTAPAPLGEYSCDHFLAHYWQKKPLLIRRAIHDFAAPIAADELAGLACESEVESRLVLGAPEQQHWQLRHGPFDESVFAALGDHNWTLLVQAVDHFVPGVAELRRRFRFIPDWRLDDVMVSFAAPGGSVGPHFDQYDVFLLQGEGRREWRIGPPCDEHSPLLPHDELHLLQHFDVVESFVLEPGDMLYLPPGIAHWGIALDPCTTFSIGFRAPSYADIISHLCDDIVQALPDSLRFSDPGLRRQDNPGLMAPAIADQLLESLSPLLERERLLDWFARYMTEAKYPGEPASASHPDRWLGTTLVLDDASRAACRLEGDAPVLYVDGGAFRRPQGAAVEPWQRLVATLCSTQQLTPEQVEACHGDPAIRTVLQQLLDHGALFSADP